MGFENFLCERCQEWEAPKDQNVVRVAGACQVPPNSAPYYKLHHECLLLLWEEEKKHLENCDKNDSQPLAFAFSFVVPGFCFAF